jgi:alginate O-acetyltransferase complex protein AlgI
MLFNSLSFLAFMSVVLLLYTMLRQHRRQNVLLLAASYFFYGVWDWRFVGLLGASTVLVYFCTVGMQRSADPRKRNALMLLAISILLAVLGAFKYLNFFAESFAQLLSLFGMHAGWTTINIILPVGISFFTFQAIGYVLDVHRGKVSATESFVECALFISFFPLLLSGPIERSTRLLPQIQQPRVTTSEDFTRGLFLILFGLFKKIVVADGLAKTIDPVFSGQAGFSSLDVTLAVYLYVLQLYCDFSGYSDVARGVARLLGFRVMKNFMTPFYAKSPSEYWTRWHISLSSWVKDYIYLPLALRYMRKGDSKLDEAKPHVYAMLLMGLWHGAAWNYILWGAYHGVMLVAWSLIKWPKSLKGLRKRIPGAAWMLLYFHVTLFSLLIFRASSVEQIGQLLAAMFSFDSTALHLDRPTFATLMAMPLFLVLDHLAYRHQSERFYLGWPPAARGVLYASIFTLLLMGLSNASTQFIYFQF